MQERKQTYSIIKVKKLKYPSIKVERTSDARCLKMAAREGNDTLQRDSKDLTQNFIINKTQLLIKCSYREIQRDIDTDVYLSLDRDTNIIQR